MHPNIDAVRSLIASIRSSVKRRNMYEIIRNTLGLKHEIRCLDVPTRWSSTFHMIKKAYEARHVLDTMTSRCPDLQNKSISNDTWDTVSTISTFLQSAASLTECQSGSTYVTLSMSVKLRIISEGISDPAERVQED